MAATTSEARSENIPLLEYESGMFLNVMDEDGLLISAKYVIDYFGQIHFYIHVYITLE